MTELSYGLLVGRVTMKGSQANEYFRNAHIVISEVLFSLLGTANILGVMYDLNTNSAEEFIDRSREKRCRVFKILSRRNWINAMLFEKKRCVNAYMLHRNYIIDYPHMTKPGLPPFAPQNFRVYYAP